MLDKLMKLKEAKQHGPMRPVEQNAKMSVLKNLIGEANSEMGDGLKSMKKVSVMAPSEKGLSAGLDKAKELVGDESDEGSPEEEAMESPEEEQAEAHSPEECSPEEEAMSPEDLDKRIQALMSLKEEKLSSHSR